MIKLASFDIFDTCIFRTVVVPTDLFLVLAERFKENIESIYGKQYKFVFRNARIEAEKRARLKALDEEVNLFGIWSELVQLIPELDIEMGIKQELEVESASYRPNSRLLELSNSYRKRFGTLIFISDTYFPEDFILRTLQQHGFWKTGDRLYASSSIGKRKDSGTLFDYVIDNEDIIPHELIHIGDNWHSDHVIPRSKGIQTNIFTEGRLTDLEAKVYKESGFDDSVEISKLVAAMRSYRLLAKTKEEQSINNFTSSFNGPILFIFASWILLQAKNDGIKKLYFFSRDCYALEKIANYLSSQNENIDCQYLMLSRQSLLVSIIGLIKSRYVPWLFRLFDSKKLQEFMSIIGLSSELTNEKIRKYREYSFEIKSELDWHYFWTLIKNQFVVTDEHIKKSEALIEYLESKGIFTENKIGVVDIGWFLTGQSCLQYCLRSKKPTINIIGYYLALNEGRIYSKDTGVAKALFQCTPDDKRKQTKEFEIFNRPVLIEHLLACAPHGMVCDYKKKADGFCYPVTQNISTDQVNINQKLANAALDFAKVIGEPLFMKQDQFCRIIDLILKTTYENPATDWMYALNKLSASGQHDNSNSTNIVEPYTYSELFFEFLPYPVRKKFGSSRPVKIWPEISESASSFDIKLLLKLRRMLTRIKYKLFN